GPIIIGFQISTQHQRRTKKRPQRKQRSLLVMRKARITWLPPSRSRSQVTNRQHVGIRPMPRFGYAGPLGNIGKLVSHTLRIFDCAVPLIPDIVRDSPHLSILSHLLSSFPRRRTGRETKDDRPLGFVERLAKHANLIALVGSTADAINLD